MNARETNITVNSHCMPLTSDNSERHDGPIQLDYKKPPSSFMTLWHAFTSQKHTYKSGQVLPDIELSGTKIDIDQNHLAAFNQICGDQTTEHISPLYPFTIVYPYMLRLLSHRDIPLSIFRSLNTRNKLVMFQPIRMNDTLDIRIRLSGCRVVEKGVEVDAKSGIFKNNELAWENIHTYYYRGQYGETDASFKPPRLDPIENGQISDQISAQFRIEAKYGFRFARLTGDTNGIHYNSLYARMLGFKGAFSQPLRVVSKCLQHLPINDSETPVLLELFYKGPVYYNRLLRLKHMSRKKSFRFDLYSEDDDRPSICGHYQTGISLEGSYTKQHFIRGI